MAPTMQSSIVILIAWSDWTLGPQIKSLISYHSQNYPQINLLSNITPLSTFHFFKWAEPNQCISTCIKEYSHSLTSYNSITRVASESVCKYPYTNPQFTNTHPLHYIYIHTDMNAEPCIDTLLGFWPGKYKSTRCS